MTEIKIIEFILMLLIFVNCIGFGVAFGRINFLMDEYKTELHRRIKDMRGEQNE